ncbi:MAG TPA: hypothetical protein VNA14_06635 [Mycobacteriales bacterium]|nr:hypothetical protein [Mycobacteriales bacterium]
MEIVAFVLGLIVLYVLLGVRSFRSRRKASGRTPARFALAELGGGIRVAAAWMLWPLVSWPDEDDS